MFSILGTFGANPPTSSRVVGPHPSHTFRHSTTMDLRPGFHNRGHHISLKIRSLLTSLPQEQSEFDKAAQNIEFWIEYILREQFMTVDELVEGVSYAAWDSCSSSANVARFFKEFRNTPHRSERARSLVDKLCEHILRWFAIAAAEDFHIGNFGTIAVDNGGRGLMHAASIVGHLIECGMLGHDLVRRHLIKPLIAHHVDIFRASAIYHLFLAAGNTLLCGLLEPEDVKICFEALNAQAVPLANKFSLYTAGKLPVRRIIHSHNGI